MSLFLLFSVESCFVFYFAFWVVFGFGGISFLLLKSELPEVFVNCFVFYFAFRVFCFVLFCSAQISELPEVFGDCLRLTPSSRALSLPDH